MLLLNAEDVRKSLPMKEAIEAMKNAYASLSNGTAVVPLRTRLAIPKTEALSLFMPAFVNSQEGDALEHQAVPGEHHHVAPPLHHPVLRELEPYFLRLRFVPLFDRAPGWTASGKQNKTYSGSDQSSHGPFSILFSISSMYGRSVACGARSR